MNRATRILSRGWLSTAVSVETFGYYLTSPIYNGLVCASVSLSVPGATLALTTPSATIALRVPSATIDLEACSD